MGFFAILYTLSRDLGFMFPQKIPKPESQKSQTLRRLEIFFVGWDFPQKSHLWSILESKVLTEEMAYLN